MAGYEFGQLQYNSQIQVQKLSQAQIQTLNLLALSHDDLYSEIMKAVDENPALQIVGSIKSKTETQYLKSRQSGDVYLSKRYGDSEKSERHQAMIEAEADNRQTLREHLLFQLDVMKLSEAEKKLGRKLIDNLDERGFHILSPVSLCDAAAGETKEMLDKMIDVIQRLDPVGTCCVGTNESLLVQAKISEKASVLAVFFLSGNLEMLNPPVSARIQKKLLAYKAGQKKLSFANESQAASIKSSELSEDDCSLEKIEDALTFIRSLNPLPANGFGISSTRYVQPDVYISKKTGHYEKDDYENGIVVCDENNFYSVELANEKLPKVRVSKKFLELASENKNGDIANAIGKANAFVESLEYRTAAILRVSCQLVRAQKAFFEKGTGNLVPLTRREIAEMLDVHESTVSRMADSKYIQCAWGLFPMKYFFTSGVASGDGDSVSRESVLAAMKKILELQPAGAKPLSDQKMADALSEQGIKIARRTVAKYRSLLDVASSYDR